MKNKKINISFYFLLIVIFIPRIFLYFSDSDLEKSVQHFDQTAWTIKDKNNQILKESAPLIGDLSKDKDLSKVNYWVFEKEVNFEKTNNLSIVLGRIGDSDKLFVNECFVSSTGFKGDKAIGWFWSHMSFYKIPAECIKEKNLISIHVETVGGPPYGIFGGPLGYGDYEKLNKKILLNNFLRYGTLIVFGLCLLIFISTYYFFHYILIPERKYYKYFATLSFSVGTYLILTGCYPFFIVENPIFLFKALFLSAVVNTIYLIYFYQYKFKIFQKNLVYKIYFVASATVFLISLPFKSIISTYPYYKIWYILFLLFFVYFFIRVIQLSFKTKNNEYFKYVIGVCILFVCTISDIITTLLGYSSPYLITYGFMSVVMVLSLSMSKEASDAFLYVEEQVGERTKDLSSALEQLKGLEKMKERFFANISHDLKTPITIALGAIEDTKGQFATVIGRVLEPADRSLRRLQDMVLSILDNVKAESGTLSLEWRSVKVVEFLQNTIEPYKSICRKEGVQLKFSGQGFEGLSVPMDPTKIERVLENLLSNAFKFTKKTTRPEKVIEVSIATDQAKLYIYIDDSGIGIPETERQKVFERFFQSSRTNLKEHGGSGIGLSFVQEMIHLHNGHVSAHESPFHGTRMAIELPLSQNIENIQNYRIQNANPKALQGSLDVEYPPTTPEKINPGYNTLLVAEDNPEVAQIVYSTLKDKYNIYFAENGKRALALLNEQSFDCVVSDIEMPEMTGDEFVENARKENKWKSIPIIMLSSHGDEDTIVKLLKLGANDYVQKPFRREILLSRIQAQINANKGTTWNTKLEKLQELGQLVSGIGHQGKNRIGRIGSNYPLLLKISKDLVKKISVTEPDEAKRLGDKVQALGDLIDKGYHQTVDLFKAIDRYASGSDKKTVISIEEVVQDSLTLLEEKIKTKNISVQTENLANASFEGYNEFREAVLNIISNAIDAVEQDKGAITIKAEVQEKDILLSITDNGMGIAKENLAHVFEPFFTSKQVGQGTGLGLYLARDAVELKNQGKLIITSKGTGHGATVHITVPKIVSDVKQSRLTMHNVGV